MAEAEPAFIIGNGPSRKNRDLTRLIGQGCTFGCNAIYRDYPDYSIPDYLVAIDPIITEETPINYIKRKEWKKYWLVDPLDGTKDFINKSSEFTVNICFYYNAKNRKF